MADLEPKIVDALTRAGATSPAKGCKADDLVKRVGAPKADVTAALNALVQQGRIAAGDGLRANRYHLIA